MFTIFIRKIQKNNLKNTSTNSKCFIVADPGDKEYPLDRPSYVIWAIGRLDDNKEPTFHDIYPKGNIKIDFNRKEPESNCFSFTRSNSVLREPWEKAQIFDRTIRTFVATLGPSAGKRGYQGITGKNLFVLVIGLLK